MRREWGAIVFCADGERWIEAQLDQLYRFVSRILVVDGAQNPAVSELPDEPATIQNGPVVPSSDGSRALVAGYPDPDGIVELIEDAGEQADVLNRAMARIETPNFLVFSADEFVSDLALVISTCERMPDCDAFVMPIVEFRAGAEHCLRRTDPVLVAARKRGGFRFNGRRAFHLEAWDHLDDHLLRYGHLDEEAPASGDGSGNGLERFLNQHPAPAARVLRAGGWLAGDAPVAAHERPLMASIIVPFWNAVDVTQRCAETVLRVTSDRYRWELILQDDGSTEDTSALAATAADERVRLLRNAENLGFLRTVNSAARQARGKYVVLLNNDTEPEAEWLEALIETAERDPRVGAVGAMFLYPDGSLQEAGGMIFSDAGGWHYGHGDRRERARYNFAREVDYCSGATLMVPRALFEEIGWFDERFAPAYYEDTDLCFEVRRRGYKVVYQPRSKVVHLEGYSCGTDLESGIKRYQKINRERFLEKWKDTLAGQPPNGSSPHRIRERSNGRHFLVAAPSFPLFDRDSGSFRLFQIIEMLRGMGHRVTFFARLGGGHGHHRKALEDLGVATCVGKHAHEAALSNAETVHKRLKWILRKTPVDVALLYYYRTSRRLAPHIRQCSPLTRIVTDSVDVHYRRLSRMAKVLRDPELKRDAKRTRRKELAAYRRSDLVIAISDEEADFLREELPRTPVRTISNIHPIPARVPPFSERKDLLFVGSFSHPPNGDALRYLIEEILPLARERVPGVRLHVVGAGKDPRSQSLAREGVTFFGYVEDLDPVLHAARLFVAPLRFGGGAKGKIGQALAFGLPIVTTAIGMEGLDLVGGENVLQATSAVEFADAIARAYTDESLWQRLSRNGVEHVRRRFSPEVVERAVAAHIAPLGRFEPSLRRKLVQVRNLVH